MVIFKNFFGNSEQSEIMTTAIDLAEAAAEFASNKNDISPLLHELSVISSQASPGALIARDDEEAVFDIYLKLEHYLMTADPLRTFDRNQLRNKASKGLRARLEAYEKSQVLHREQTVNA